MMVLSDLLSFLEKGECIITKGEIEILQVQEEPNTALAWASTSDYFDRIVVLLVNYEGKSYYDQQKIKIPAGKCARQIGTYQYNTAMDDIPKRFRQ